MEEEYVQEHILTDSIVIVAPVGGCLTSSRCLAIGPYTFNEVRCIRPILLNRKNALFAGLGSTNDESRQLTAVTGHRRPRIRAPLYGSAGGLQSWFGDLRSTTATDLDAALLRSRQRRLCALRNHSGRVRQRPLRTQIANAHWKVSRSCHIRASCCAEDRIADLEAGAQLYREKAERADLCALSPFIRRLARPLSERERDAHCGIAYFVGEHAILDRARQHHTADA